MSRDVFIAPSDFTEWLKIPEEEFKIKINGAFHIALTSGKRPQPRDLKNMW